MKKIVLLIFLSVFSTLICLSAFPSKANAAEFILDEDVDCDSNYNGVFSCDLCCGTFTVELDRVFAKEVVTNMQCGETLNLTAYAEMKKGDKMANDYEAGYSTQVMAYVQKSVFWGNPTSTLHTSTYLNGEFANHNHRAVGS